MPEPSNKLIRLWEELKRRKVIHVIVVYATAAFVIIELVNNVYEPLKLPDWTPTMVIVILAIGFPFAIIFSWIFDISGKGIRKTEPYNATRENSDLPPEFTRPSENSIAILPFENMSADVENEYFCDGITEEIINALTKIEDVYVVARTSSFAFKGQNTDVREIGRKLGVATLLEGSVRKSGKKLRITAQLINIENGYHLWSESYDRQLSDIFEIQDEISMNIVEKLRISIKPDEKNVLQSRYRGDIKAYNLYLKGRYFWNRLTKKDLLRALDLFKEATDIDANYAPAFSGMADSYCRLAWYSYMAPARALPKAKEAAAKALQLNDMLPEAVASLGFVSMCFDRDYEKAIGEFRKAIRLDPGFSGAHSYYSICLAITGRHQDAIMEARHALELDPLTPMMLINLAGRYYYARQYPSCVESVRKALELDPGFEIAHYYLAYFYNQMGKQREALQEIHRVIKKLGRDHIPFLAALAIILAYSGDIKGAGKVMDEIAGLPNENKTSFFWLGAIYTVLEKHDEAIEMFEKAFLEREVLMIFLNVDPVFDQIKNEPEFQALLRKMNFSV
jgi:TolB-like protein